MIMKTVAFRVDLDTVQPKHWSQGTQVPLDNFEVLRQAARGVYAHVMEALGRNTPAWWDFDTVAVLPKDAGRLRHVMWRYGWNWDEYPSLSESNNFGDTIEPDLSEVESVVD